VGKHISDEMFYFADFIPVYIQERSNCSAGVATAGFGCRNRSTASFVTCSATFPPTEPVTTNLSRPCHKPIWSVQSVTESFWTKRIK